VHLFRKDYGINETGEPTGSLTYWTTPPKAMGSFMLLHSCGEGGEQGGHPASQDPSPTNSR
jgi:hypothetical protein